MSRRRSNNKILGWPCVATVFGILYAVSVCALFFFHHQIPIDERASPLEAFKAKPPVSKAPADDRPYLPEESPQYNESPIDDYFARPHLTNNQVPLIVGGSDGSGTRAVVDILEKLGVTMLIEDNVTKDIHAAVMFGGAGWPPLAKLALRRFPPNNNSTKAIPKEARETCTDELKRLRIRLEMKFKVMVAKKNHSPPKKVDAKLTTFGFKAPITMLLVPMLQEHLYPSFKYLHVVRDGRDIALSSNQSPVQKLYREMYHKDWNERLERWKSRLAHVLSIQLWSDSNARLLQWERENQNDVDYAVVRAEDLLHPDTKFTALTMLADFVGSTASPHEICCLARAESNDLGQSHAFTKNKLKAQSTSVVGRLYSETLDVVGSFVRRVFYGRKKRRRNRRPQSYGDEELAKLLSTQLEALEEQQVAVGDGITTRYGKWARLLQSHPELSQAMHHEGRLGLAAFGYEPKRRFMDTPPPPSSGDAFACDATIVC